MTDTIGFNEGKDFILDAAIHGALGISTVYFLISNTSVVTANLTAGITLPTGTINVDDTSAFPASGTFTVGGQTVNYTGKTPTSFTGCTGGTGTMGLFELCYGSTGHQPVDTLATGVGEITAWTGTTPYARISQAVPAPANGIVSFTQMTWNVSDAVDGPTAAASVVMATTADNTGKALYAWNILNGGGGSNFVANTQFQFTPTFFLQNVGGS